MNANSEDLHGLHNILCSQDIYLSKLKNVLIRKAKIKVIVERDPLPFVDKGMEYEECINTCLTTKKHQKR